MTRPCRATAASFTRRKIARRPRGVTLIYGTIAMITLSGFVSFAVDFGRTEVTKTELQRAADSAARYALQGISDGTAVSKAITSAAENKADGSAVVLLNSDVTTGTWAGGIFTPGGSPANAVRITAYRTAARGTAVPTTFGRILGVLSCNVTATSTAYRVPAVASTYGMVGNNSVAISNGVIIDSYDSNVGTYGGVNVANSGNVGSNGTIALSGSSTKIGGEVDYGNGSTYTNSGATVNGTIAQLGGTLTYPTPTPPAAGTYSYYGAVSESSGTMVVPGGQYYFDSISLTGGTFTFSGPATLYVNGALSMSGGSIAAYQNHPANLRIVELSSTANVNLAGTLNLTADVYAPNSTFTASGSPAVYGRIIAKSVNMSGGALHFDTSMGSIGTYSGGGAISIVK